MAASAVVKSVSVYYFKKLSAFKAVNSPPAKLVPPVFGEIALSFSAVAVLALKFNTQAFIGSAGEGSAFPPQHLYLKTFAPKIFSPAFFLITPRAVSGPKVFVYNSNVGAGEPVKVILAFSVRNDLTFAVALLF